jgi:cytochrome c-type biogenesis protein CcmF
MLTVLLGTLYPLIAEALGMGKLSVGAPYFNAVFIPIMTPVALLIGIGAIVRWKQDDYIRVGKQLRYLFLASLVVGGILGITFFDNHLFRTIAGIVAALWVILTSLSALMSRLKHRQNKLVALQTIPRGFYGMTLAHIGFAVTIIGITITSQHSVDVHQRMAPGDVVAFADYQFSLEALRPTIGPNFKATEAVVKVTKNGKHVTDLHSQKRIYTVRNMPMTEAGIDSSLMRDIYVSLGEPLDDNAWSIRLYHKPFVRWIWLGAIFMALGGLLAATDRRYRLKVESNKTAPVEGGAVSLKS